MGRFSSQTIPKTEEEEKEDKTNDEPHDASGIKFFLKRNLR